ncbi:DUF397 domain-containing protein [Streptomyces anthocyanicus]|uniref:DUF397 domain-containing protein n=1 Tax=Streptomyces anthocyanicus TaxID=68174 RepID=UPI00381880B5
MTRNSTAHRSTDFAPEGAWRKASYSDQGGGNCVEIAEGATAVGVRDSKNADGPALVFSNDAFAALIGSISG